jgi:hypothetical protein
VNLLIACYELGHQRLSLAWPLAFLRQAGLDAATLDLATQPFSDDLAARTFASSIYKTICSTASPIR